MPNKTESIVSKTRIELMYSGAGRSYRSDRDIEELKENIRNNFTAVGFWQGIVYEEYGGEPLYLTINPLVCNMILSEIK